MANLEKENKRLKELLMQIAEHEIGQFGIPGHSVCPLASCECCIEKIKIASKALKESNG